MTKIPLDIDTRSLAKSIERSKRNAMTKSLIRVIEGAIVGLAAVIAWRMVVTILSL